VRVMLKMSANDALFDDVFAREHYDGDSLDFMEEMLPYELIHALLADICRLEKLVVYTRDEVNRLSSGVLAYDMTAQDVSDDSYYEFPAFKRYMELYGDWAVIPWEC